MPTSRRLTRMNGGSASAVGVVLIAVLLAWMPVVALAAGDASLQSEILRDPLPHGRGLPSDYLAGLVTGLQRVEANAGSGITASTAALGWFNGPDPQKRSLVVILVALDMAGKSSSYVNEQTALAAQSAAATICAGAVGTPPDVYTKVRGLAHSHYIQCDRSPDGTVINALTTSRGEVFAMLISNTKTVPRHQLETIAMRQYRALHAPTPFVST